MSAPDDGAGAAGPVHFAPAVPGAASARPAPAAPGLRWAGYGLLALPLAFAALPLYVSLPAWYAQQYGVPLAALGGLLLAARMADAVIDPWIGQALDRLFARSLRGVIALALVAAFALAGGFALLFMPPVRGTAALLAWAGMALAITYFAWSALTVLHQAWGAMLGGDAAQRAAIAGWREGLGLAGVLLAAVLPSFAGWATTSAVLAVLALGGVAALAASPRPRATRAAATGHAGSWRLPFAQPAFRRLLAVFLFNGIASAVPATLLLFFVRDRLQAPPALEPAFLGTYFLVGAASVPLWLRGVRRFGLGPCWLAGMLLAVLAFGGAALLGAGDGMAFLAVCAASGLALGADLPLPGALLAGVIARAGHSGRHEGAYVGWWNFATKLNLALAAGLALPLLSLAGYAPGSRDPAALDALTLAYCALPCGLKLCAAALLARALRKPEGLQ
ncbi:MULTISPECIES: MFS transporter [Ramlibacter]|uniref:MFS transporter n=1 Tax=Ramlibacter aquaticus TaxID=2780094 RepID=A0ABR9SIM8_9BURK|nr:MULTISPECIES: MFS transporter [Ramlibacter]MBE7942208.1 MFS transporter [Ramlibacter aquaticus]